MEKAEERQREESGSSQQEASATSDQLLSVPAPTTGVTSPTGASSNSSSAVSSKDAMQVDEEDEEMSNAAQASDSESKSQGAASSSVGGKTRSSTGNKKRQTKGGKSAKEPASDRKVETVQQPISSDKYLQIEEGIPPKSKVAARISGASEESGYSGFWILASVLKYYPDKNRYDVIDEDNSDDEETTHTDRKTYKLNKNHIVQLPTDFSQHKPFKKGDQVFAVFPDTTTFYPAIVDTAPTKNSKNYYLKFEDDEEDGKTPLRKVSFKNVMAIPKQ